MREMTWDEMGPEAKAARIERENAKWAVIEQAKRKEAGLDRRDECRSLPSPHADQRRRAKRKAQRAARKAGR